MKIKINYDVIDKIQIFNRGYDLKRIALINTVSGLLTFLLFLPVSDHKISSMIKIGIAATFGALFWSSIDVFADKKMRVSKSIAEDQLQDLVKNLETIQVYTNLVSLQEAKVIKTNYKLQVNDKKIPVVKQEKYINIPTINKMGKQQEETIYQEHIIGTKDYDISVGEPEKKVQVKRKLARAM